MLFADEKAKQRSLRAFAKVECDGFITADELQWDELKLRVAYDKATTLAHGLGASAAFKALARPAEYGWVDRICRDYDSAERTLAGGKERSILPDPTAVEGDQHWFAWLRHPGRLGRSGRIYSVDISPDGRWVAVAGAVTAPAGRPQEADVLIWDRKRMVPFARLAGLRQGVQRVRFDTSSTQVAAVDSRGVGIVWDLDTHKKIERFKVKRSKPNVLVPGAKQFSTRETYSRLATSSRDGRLCVDVEYGTVRLLRSSSGKTVAELNTKGSSVGVGVRGLAFGPDSKLAIVFESDIVVWDYEKNEAFGRTFTEQSTSPTALTWLPDEAALGAVYSNEPTPVLVSLPGRLEGDRFVAGGTKVVFNSLPRTTKNSKPLPEASVKSETKSKKKKPRTLATSGLIRRFAETGRGGVRVGHRVFCMQADEHYFFECDANGQPEAKRFFQADTKEAKAQLKSFPQKVVETALLDGPELDELCGWARSLAQYLEQTEHALERDPKAWLPVADEKWLRRSTHGWQIWRYVGSHWRVSAIRHPDEDLRKASLDRVETVGIENAAQAHVDEFDAELDAHLKWLEDGGAVQTMSFGDGSSAYFVRERSGTICVHLLEDRVIRLQWVDDVDLVRRLVLTMDDGKPKRQRFDEAVRREVRTRTAWKRLFEECKRGEISSRMILPKQLASLAKFRTAAKRGAIFELALS